MADILQQFLDAIGEQPLEQPGQQHGHQQQRQQQQDQLLAGTRPGVGAQGIAAHGQHHHALPLRGRVFHQRVAPDQQLLLLQPVQMILRPLLALVQQPLDGRDAQRHAGRALRQTEGAHPPGIVEHCSVDQRRMVEVFGEQVADPVGRVGTALAQAAGQEVADEVGGGFQLADRLLQRMAIDRHYLIHGDQQAEAEKGTQQQRTQSEQATHP
ncbi:hypothetical protein D3C80_1135620 [compost metagenome]